ncbi:MAG: hypothetical protein EXR47_00955 [Dehalococcoidia bacterium]|nr:hypothetical protein [Dehalococcoidia bacterium]
MRLIGASVLVIAAIAAMALVAGRGADGGDDDEIDNPKPVHGRDVGDGTKLWVFVSPHRADVGSSVPNQCVDGDQLGTLPQFAKPRASSLTLSINRTNIPSYLNKDAVTGAVKAACGAWDAVNTARAYFIVNNTGGKSGPLADGVSSVGWRKMTSGTLAATWVWMDSSGNVAKADIFYNTLYSWALFAACDAASKPIDIQGVGTHEVGHAISKDHLSDTYQHATMYPSAWPGEIKKRTLTTGEVSSNVS